LEEDISIALIGCGGIAAGYGEDKGGHLLALEQMGCKVHTYCDQQVALAEKRLRQYGGVRATGQPEDVFSDPSIRAVMICTRHDSHAALAVQAARAGKHVFVEKPLGMTVEACREVVDAARNNRVKVMVAFTKRFTPAFRALEKFRGQAKLIVARCTESEWGTDFWWGHDPVCGGGNVFMNGIHMADAMLWLSDSNPVRVYATGGPVSPAGPTRIDKAFAVVDFANGCRGVFITADTGLSDYLSKFSLEFHTGLGCAVAHRRLTALEVTNIPGLEPLRSDTENFGGAIQAFLESLDQDTPSPVPPEAGLQATQLVQTMIESIRTGQPVLWRNLPGAV